jgi:mannose-6-phosphate isomerase-like protein (cupin superfamily)
MKLLSSAIGVVILWVGLSAQTPPPPAQPRPRPRPAAIQVTVRDHTGAPIPYVHITVAGTISRDVLTNADGAATLVSMPDGTYRVRFDKDGFHTLERDVIVRSGAPRQLDVELSSSAAPVPPPQPEPAAAPAPAAPPPAAAPAPSGPPVTLSIPAFLDKNFIGGREPLKESVVGCTAASTTRLLQMREPIAAHTHDLDEILYVVAGDGAVRIRPAAGGGGGESHEETMAVSAGTLSVIPRGISHAIERRGRNPLIVLSTLAGAPCQTPTGTHQAAKK